MKRLALFFLSCLLCPAVTWGFPTEPSPNGAARVRQITSAYTEDPTKSIEQRVFLSTDALTFQGLYFDPNDACLPIDTEQVRILVAKASGEIVLYEKADSGHYDHSLSDYYRGFNFPFKTAGWTFPPGSYVWTVIAQDCTGTVWTALPYWNGFQVVE